MRWTKGIVAERNFKTLNRIPLYMGRNGDPLTSAYYAHVHVHVCCMYLTLFIHVPLSNKYICWKLLSNRNFKGPYLEAEVVEEVMGWLG